MMLITALNMAYYSATDDITFTPLTEEEETRLFKIFLNTKPGSKTGLAARDELITRHLKLVVKLSLAAAKQAIPDDIAISAGNAALMQALECRRFKPELGIRFATYLRLFIRGQINKAIRSHQHPRIDRDPGSSRQTFAEEPALTGQPARNAKNITPPVIDPFFDSAVHVDHPYEAEELGRDRERAIKKAMLRLKGLELVAIREVYLEGRSYAEVGRRNGGVSRQAVEQASHKGLKKLRIALSPLKSDLL